MGYAFLAAIIVSLGLGVLLGMLAVAHKPRRRRDRFTRAIAEEAYGDVPFVSAGYRPQREWGRERAAPPRGGSGVRKDPGRLVIRLPETTEPWGMR